MLLKDWPIQFSGTLKNISKEQAKSLFNFDLPDNAKGIIFRQREDYTQMMAYVPEKYKAPPALLKNAVKMTIIGKFIPQIKKDIIDTVWEAIAKQKKKHSRGCHMFVAYNICRDIRKIEDIVISTGRLPAPEIISVKYASGKQGNSINLKLKPVDHQIAVLLLDKETHQTQFFKPKSYKDGIINLPTRFNPPIIFAYAHDGNNYSPSTTFLSTNEHLPRSLQKYRQTSGPLDFARGKPGKLINTNKKL